ncbi:ABC transporter permease [Actinomadura sp. 1N219]|uniref:ABC transporter permease n=1 Tax=Actinomadura sp. 1N219 TaxID=3375152 RepID=UPI0037A1DE3F
MTGVAQAPPLVARPALRRAYGRLLLPTVTVVALLAVEEVLSRLDVLPSADFPPVSKVGQVLYEELSAAPIWTAIWQTLLSSVLGLAIAAALAVPIGLLLGISTLANRSVRVVVEFLRPIPPITIVPLAILMFGTGLSMKLLLIVFGCFWALLIQTMYGAGETDPVLSDAARAYGFGPWWRFRRMTLPSAAPFIATGLRLSAMLAVGLSVVAELVGGATGLGQTIFTAQLADDMPRMYAVVVLAALLGMALERVLRLCERRVLHWHEAYRPGVGA